MCCIAWIWTAAGLAAARSRVDVAITIRRAAQNIDRSLARAMQFTSPTTFQDFCSFVFGNHALDLKQQILLRCFADFVIQENRIRIYISESAYERERLDISAQLLRIATVVK